MIELLKILLGGIEKSQPTLIDRIKDNSFDESIWIEAIEREKRKKQRLW